MDRTAVVLLFAVHTGVLTLCALLTGLVTACWSVVLLFALSYPTTPGVILWIVGLLLVCRATLLLPTLVAAALAGAAATSLHRGQRRFVGVTIVSAMIVPILNLTLCLMTFDPMGITWLISFAMGLALTVATTLALPGTRGRTDEW